MTNSRAKGARGERDAAAFLRRIGFSAARGQQYHGGSDSPDVVTADLPRVHLEVKRTETIGTGTNELRQAMGQSMADAGADQVPCVLWRRSRQPWHLTFFANGPAILVTVTGDDEIRHGLLWLQNRAERGAA